MKQITHINVRHCFIIRNTCSYLFLSFYIICHSNSILTCYIKHGIGGCLLFSSIHFYLFLSILYIPLTCPSFFSLYLPPFISPTLPTSFLFSPLIFLASFLNLEVLFSILFKEQSMKLLFKQHFHISPRAHLNANCSYNNSVPLLLWLPFCV